MSSSGMFFEQSQKQQFSLQMRHALRLLQMTNLELISEITSEVTSNPLLEAVHPQILPIQNIPADGRSSAQVNSAPQYDYIKTSGYQDGVNGERELSGHAETMVEHLQAQLAFTTFNVHESFVAETLIGELEPDGYLTTDIDLVAGRLGTSLSIVQKVLDVLKTFDPPGIFAKNLNECLRLQLLDKNRLDPLISKLLSHLDLMAQGKHQELLKLLSCEREDLDDMLGEIRALTPKPGLAFGFEQPPTIIPEVRVSKSKAGEWVVESWKTHLPKLVVKEGQFDRLTAKCHKDEEVKYLKERLSSARRFADLIQRRGRTILEVAAEIVKRQEAFLEIGLPGLKPLMMKTVADTLGIHESTVSRAVTNKAILTPRGVIAFKTFFAAPASHCGDDDTTQTQVIERIKSLIGDEKNTGKVLSDEALTQALEKEGIKIARRTVTKHRENIGLATSSRRKAQLRGK